MPIRVRRQEALFGLKWCQNGGRRATKVPSVVAYFQRQAPVAWRAGLPGADRVWSVPWISTTLDAADKNRDFLAAKVDSMEKPMLEQFAAMKTMKVRVWSVP